MVSKSNIRVCVSTQNHISRLFSVIERENLDLIIKIGAADLYRKAELPKGVIVNQIPTDSDLNNQDDDLKIINQKYSVHCSLQSEDRINAIVHRIKLSNNNEISTYHYTRALKQTNKYAPLYMARAPDLSIARYKVNPNERDYISISSFHTNKATLYYMVSVCNFETELIFDGEDFNVKYINFKNFRLAIIWSYANLPSYSTGVKTHFQTFKTDELPKSVNAVIKDNSEGYSAFDILNAYRELRYLQHLEIFNTLRKELDLDLIVLNKLFSFPFVK